MALKTTAEKITAGAAVLVLAVLVPLGNPALALLAASLMTVVLNRPLLPGAGTLGTYSLQTAIVLLGLKLNMQQLWAISANYSLLVTGYVLTTIAVGLALGLLLRNERNSSRLITSGTAICGGTTIASLSPVIHARPEQTGVALAIIFILNAVALFSFPAIGHSLQLSQEQFGIWAALAIHDTSSVVATAALYGEEAAEVATTLKLGRTLWLIPLLLVFSLIERAPNAKLRIPGFILAFLLASAAGSLLPLPAVVSSWAGMLSKALLVCALFFIGSQINRATLRNLRGAALWHAVLLWVLVVPATLGLILYLT
ncbi:MAG: putative sulfate exporter family transporter [Gammaproteobacteria bacterium]|nr:putative sulfate exporter family transporter [Gammaproteobacteria bacterium]